MDLAGLLGHSPAWPLAHVATRPLGHSPRLDTLQHKSQEVFQDLWQALYVGILTGCLVVLPHNLKVDFMLRSLYMAEVVAKSEGRLGNNMTEKVGS